VGTKDSTEAPPAIKTIKKSKVTTVAAESVTDTVSSLSSGLYGQAI